MAGIRLWPPDNILALSPYAASNSSALLILVARAYAKAEAFIATYPPRPAIGIFIGLDGGDL
jgi:hypothetical protein